jgi:hypothetical protein
LDERERFKALSKEQKAEKKLISERKALEKRRKDDEKAVQEEEKMQKLGEARNRNGLRLERLENFDV